MAEQHEAIEARVPRSFVHRIEAGGVSIFYREAGPLESPTVL